MLHELFEKLEESMQCSSDRMTAPVQVRLADGKTFLPITGVYVDRLGIVKIQAGSNNSKE